MWAIAAAQIAKNIETLGFKPADVKAILNTHAHWDHAGGIAALLLLGLLNGLLPCGLVYVAGAGATATGCMIEGAQYMVVFGLGTVPMLLAIGVGGSLLHARLFYRVRGRTAAWLVIGCFVICVLTIFVLPFVLPSLHAALA